jgi:hypothetical protein
MAWFNQLPCKVRIISLDGLLAHSLQRNPACPAAGQGRLVWKTRNGKKALIILQRKGNRYEKSVNAPATTREPLRKKAKGKTIGGKTIKSCRGVLF